jgi:hypothetical protein
VRARARRVRQSRIARRKRQTDALSQAPNVKCVSKNLDVWDVLVPTMLGQLPFRMCAPPASPPAPCAAAATG